MKVINQKKLAVSTLIFLFSSFNVPLLAHDAQVSQDMPVVQESIYQTSAPSVKLGTLQIVDLQKAMQQVKTVFGELSKLIVQSVKVPYAFINTLTQVTFTHYNTVSQIEQAPYSARSAGFVTMGEDSRFLTLLEQPAMNTFLGPKIVTAPHELWHLLVMSPWVHTDPNYSLLSLHSMLQDAYSAFKGYKDLMYKMRPDSPVEIHSSFETGHLGNDPYVTCAIFSIAAELAAIDKLVFHSQKSTAAEETHAWATTQKFLKGQSGKLISETLRALLSA